MKVLKVKKSDPRSGVLTKQQVYLQYNSKVLYENKSEVSKFQSI